jgi:hypothetical protein
MRRSGSSTITALAALVGIGFTAALGYSVYTKWFKCSDCALTAVDHSAPTHDADNCPLCKANAASAAGCSDKACTDKACTDKRCSDHACGDGCSTSCDSHKCDQKRDNAGAGSGCEGEHGSHGSKSGEHTGGCCPSHSAKPGSAPSSGD